MDFNLDTNQVGPSNYIAQANDSTDDPYANNRLVYNALIGLGVPDKTAAGAVGSLMGEGGQYLDAGAVNRGDGADGSDSIGFGQWNGDRAQALKALAAQMGVDPTHPQAQVAHLVNELQGSHSHVLDALKSGPNSIENGANVWTRKYEVPANADAEVQSRTGYGYQFADALNGGGSAPMAYASGDGTNPIMNADAFQAIARVAPDGKPLAEGDEDTGDDTEANAAPGNTTGSAPTASAQWDALKQSVLKNVPGLGANGALSTGLLGSLLGNGNTDKSDASKSDTGKFGNTLVRVGAALMARDNPSGAQALLNAIPKADKDTAAVRSSQVIANDQGKSFVRNIMSDGSVKVTPLQPGQVSPAEIAKANPAPKDRPPSAMEQQRTGESSRAMAQSSNQYEKAQDIQEAILNGKFSPVWNDRARAYVDNSLGKSTESSRWLKELNSLVNRSTLTTMSFQKGTATDQRMKFDLESIFPKSSQYDAATVYDSLERVKQVAQENYSGAATVLNGVASAHPTMAGRQLYIGHDKVTAGQINDYIDGKYKSWDARDTKLRDRYGEWLPTHDNPTANVPAPSVGVARPGSAFSGGTSVAPPAPAAPQGPQFSSKSGMSVWEQIQKNREDALKRQGQNPN